MRRFLLAATAAVAFLPAIAASVTAADDPVVAIVNGNELHKSQLVAMQATLPEQYRQVPLEQIYQPLLERLVDSQLLLAKANAEKLEDKPDVQAKLTQAHNDVLRDSLVEEAILAATTDDKVKAAYEAEKAKPDFAVEEVHARHILVADEATAKEIIKQLDGGGDFAAIAKEKSTDPSAKENGGDLGYFKKDAMVPEFAEAAWTITPGTYGKDPVKSQFGYHVIFVVDKRTAPPSFEEKQADIRQQLARDAVTALVDSVRQGAKIETFNLDGTKAAAQ